MLTTHNVPYVQKCIRYIFSQPVLRVPGFSQSGKLKEQGAPWVVESAAASGNAEGLVILNFGITSLIPKKTRIPKSNREPLQHKDFRIKTSG